MPLWRVVARRSTTIIVGGVEADSEDDAMVKVEKEFEEGDPSSQEWNINEESGKTSIVEATFAEKED